MAVLGCGIDRDYPRAPCRAGAADRRETGLIVSEYPPGVEPAPWRFPARNRIIAGLALATVVVEARERSGALITADFALELGREVFAVPGEITSALSAGTNGLIRQGAAPLLGVDDVLDALGIEPPSAVTAARRRCRIRRAGVLELLADQPRGADELTRLTALGPAEIAGALVELELGGLAFEADGRYRVAR